MDLTEKEVEVVECYDNEPLECVMMRVVKKEPGLEEDEEEEKEKVRAEGAGREMVSGTSADCGGTAVAAAVATGSSSTTSPRVKMEAT